MSRDLSQGLHNQKNKHSNQQRHNQRQEEPVADDEYEEPVICCGTSEKAVCWYATNDVTGLFCSIFVLSSIIYGFVVVAMSTYTGHIDSQNGSGILIITFLALWAHIKTMCSDPGVVPYNARKYNIFSLCNAK